MAEHKQKRERGEGKPHQQATGLDLRSLNDSINKGDIHGEQDSSVLFPVECFEMVTLTFYIINYAYLKSKYYHLIMKIGANFIM